jgi:hypothetical protein
VSKKNTGAQKKVIQRVRNKAAEACAKFVGILSGHAEEVAGVIERHDDHDHAAEDVDRFEARTS